MSGTDMRVAAFRSEKPVPVSSLPPKPPPAGSDRPYRSYRPAHSPCYVRYHSLLTCCDLSAGF
eukprot:3932718-Rhodomonas_salina.1